MEKPPTVSLKKDIVIEELSLYKHYLKLSEFDQEIPQPQTEDPPTGTVRKGYMTFTALRHSNDNKSKATSWLVCCHCSKAVALLLLIHFFTIDSKTDENRCKQIQVIDALYRYCPVSQKDSDVMFCLT